MDYSDKSWTNQTNSSSSLGTNLFCSVQTGPMQPYKCHEKTILEIKNAPITNIIVQHFDLCNHHTSSGTGLDQPVQSIPPPFNNGLGEHTGFYNNGSGFSSSYCNQQSQGYVDLYSYQGLNMLPTEPNEHNCYTAIPNCNFPCHPNDSLYDKPNTVNSTGLHTSYTELPITTSNDNSKLIIPNKNLLNSEQLSNFNESQLSGDLFNRTLVAYSKKNSTNKIFKRESELDINIKDNSPDKKSIRVDSPPYKRKKSRSISRNRYRNLNRSSRSPRNRSHGHFSLTLKNRRSIPKSDKLRELQHTQIRNSKPNCLPKSSSTGRNRDSEILVERSSENNSKKSLMDKISSHDLQGELEREKQVWTRTSPADLYYHSQKSDTNIVCGTDLLAQLCDEFEKKLLKKSELIRAELPKYEPLSRKKRVSVKKHSGCHSCSGSSSSSESESDQDDCTKEELEHKKKHPLRLHQELWFNDPGEMNDGPLCRCSARARRSGIRHNIYAGENHLPRCNPHSNNADRLYHYRITISPPTNFLVKTPTIIEYDEHEYIFEGFSMFSHKKLDELPLCKVIRFNIEYTIVYFEEKFPDNFTIRELDAFYTYLFQEILELVDLDLRAYEDFDGCPRYHFMPRFVRELPGNGKEILSMNEVLKYLIHSSSPLVSPDDLSVVLSQPQYDWQHFTENLKGMIVTYPGKKPCSLRVDQLDRDQDDKLEPHFPEIVHFGIRPPQLSYAGNPEYQKAWREYVKFRHLLANMPKPSFEDKRKLEAKEIRLQNMRTKSELKRNVTVTVSSEHFNKTGIMCDIVQHAMLVPVLVSHLRFHQSLDELEDKIKYKFKNRYLLQLALTHPSYRENFGTNPDHARNSLTNCGIRQPVYGDRRIHYMNTRKRGINTLINIMSRFGKTEETESNITHNERLEFLGDAVVEFVTSVHLFHMFPELEEGGLATYRAAIVQNQHLALLAKTLGLEEFMLYAHGSDLCHDLELRHAMANCFEALMGALFLDGGIMVADKVFGEALFKTQSDLLKEWVNYPRHPLQEQEPLGDRKWISKFPILQKLTNFEALIGVEFKHIRLLARAFTDRSIGYTNLTLGSNQRLEFLGDTVLQLIASEYLYKYFPEHHEGHLSLLRSSLVNNRTQAVVCNDLGMTQYALYSNPKAELKTKDRADLLEAFLGALYVDKGLEFCQVFCSVCFFPRLQDFIMHQDWNDPKSKLQQCCLTLRTMEGGEPEIPVYKVIECMGPTNTRIYTVAVYFKGRRLAKASGHSIQQAEMNAAKKALNSSEGLFPQLDHQKRVISKSMNRQHRDGTSANRSTSPKNSKRFKKNGKKENEEKKPGEKGYAIRQRTPPLAYRSRNRSESPTISPCKKGNQENNSEKYMDRKETDKTIDSTNETLLEKDIVDKIKIEEENTAVDSCKNLNASLDVPQQLSTNVLSTLEKNAHNDPTAKLSQVNVTTTYSKVMCSTSSLSNYSVKSMSIDSRNETPSILTRSSESKKRSRSKSLSRNKRGDKSPMYQHRNDSPPSYRSKHYLSKLSSKSVSRNAVRSYRSRRSRSRSGSRDKSISSMRKRSRSRDRSTSSMRMRSRSRDKSISSMRKRSRSRDKSVSSMRKRSRSRIRSRDKSISSIQRKSWSRSRSRDKSISRIRKRSRSRSRSRDKSINSVQRRSKSRDEAKERLMDFMLGKRNSPGLENRGKAFTSNLLVDFVCNKNCPTAPPQLNEKYEAPPLASNLHLNNYAPKPPPQHNIHNTIPYPTYNQNNIQGPEMQFRYATPRTVGYQNQYLNPVQLGPPPLRQMQYPLHPPVPTSFQQQHLLSFNQNTSHFQNYNTPVQPSHYQNQFGYPNCNYNNQNFSYR